MLLYKESIFVYSAITSRIYITVYSIVFGACTLGKEVSFLLTLSHFRQLLGCLCTVLNTMQYALHIIGYITVYTIFYILNYKKL